MDDPKDWQYVSKVEEYCVDLCAVGLKPGVSKLLSLRGLLTGEALSLPYYRNGKLQNWVDKIFQSHKIDAILNLSGAMAQYVSNNLDQGIKTVLDLEDVDSDKWQLYAKNHNWPLNWFFQRESKRLLAYERNMAEAFDITLFVSQEEAKLFQKLVPEVAQKVKYRVQGVDSNYFDPSLDFENPYGDNARVLVFTGAMDYWPNTDAAIWFAKEIMPKIKETVPNAQFCIVGMNPVAKVQALVKDPSIIVTGGVPDVRPYLAHAAGAVLPLRVARGIQNKILEAMAMEKAVVATPDAIHGIDPCPGFSPLISDTPEGLAKKAISLLKNTTPIQTTARACVLERYNWDANLQLIYELLGGNATELSTTSYIPAQQEMSVQNGH